MAITAIWNSFRCYPDQQCGAARVGQDTSVCETILRRLVIVGECDCLLCTEIGIEYTTRLLS